MSHYIATIGFMGQMVDSLKAFPERWQAEQWADEASAALATQRGRTVVVNVYEHDIRGQRRVGVSYTHGGDRPEALRLAVGDFDAVVSTGLVDGVPQALSGVWDDRFHDEGEELSGDVLDRLNEQRHEDIAAYELSLAYERPRFQRTDRPTLGEKKTRERA